MIEPLCQPLAIGSVFSTKCQPTNSRKEVVQVCLLVFVEERDKGSWRNDAKSAPSAQTAAKRSKAHLASRLTYLSSALPRGRLLSL